VKQQHEDSDASTERRMETMNNSTNDFLTLLIIPFVVVGYAQDGNDLDPAGSDGNSL